MNTTSILAADPNAWFSTPIGTIVQALLAGVGLIVVLLAAVRAFGKIAQGQVPAAVKGIVGAAVVAVFLFRPQLAVSLVNTLGNIVSSLISSTDSVVNNSGGAGGAPCPPGQSC
jgi:hypothetical protein